MAKATFSATKLVLFFDGCHKIYYASTDETETIAKMAEWGYEPISGPFTKNLNELWLNSCGLRFVQPANLDERYPEIDQCKPSQMRGFVTRVKNHYASLTN